MNKDTLELLLKQNLSTIKEFVSLMFDSLKKEISVLRSENNELKQSLTFTQAELSDLKKSSAEQGNLIASTIEQEASMATCRKESVLLRISKVKVLLGYIPN